MDYEVHLYTKYAGVQWWCGLCSSSLTIECAGKGSRKGSESFCTTIV